MKDELFAEFDPISVKAWKQQAQYSLKGKDYNESLVWDSPEGIKTKPFYTFEDLEKVYLHPSDAQLSWRIAQSIFVSDVEKANQKALDILRKGAESLIFTIPFETIEPERLLDEIDIEKVHLHFDTQFLSSKFTEKLVAFAGKSSFNLFHNIDVIGKLARTGNWFFNKERDFGYVQDILFNVAQNQSTNLLHIDTSLYQNAGANMVQQLAYALAHANEYLNRFNLETVGELTFKVATGSNYFFEIAKIRALRQLWKLLDTEYGVSTNCHIQAIPSKRNKTLYAYNTNLLRSSTECMSAILGGADTVCNLPYDSLYHKDNEFAERIARNQLLILKEESYFDSIENPASGSYYIESLTRQLAEKALVLFKDIEKNGGFLKQLENGTIQRKIKESALSEQQRHDSISEIQVGTNKFRNAADKMKDTIEINPFLKARFRKTCIAPIIEKRLAEKSEKERLKKERWTGSNQYNE